MQNIQRIFFYTLIIVICNSLRLNAQAPEWIWAKGFGGKGNDASLCTTVDKFGNVYFAGHYADSITFGSTKLKVKNPLSWQEVHDLFLAKCDVNGNLLWVKAAGGYYNGLQNVYNIITDDSGNIYLTGRGAAENTFGEKSIGVGSLFLAKYDPSGALLWNYSTGGGNFMDEGRSIDIDKTGNIYITGKFRQYAKFGDIVLRTLSADDVFLVKYNSDGKVLWAQSAGGNSNDYGFSLAIDNSGDLFLTGMFHSDTIRFGTFTLVNSCNSGINNPDYLVAKFNPNGEVIWAQSAGGKDGYDAGLGITTDKSGNVYVTGYFSSSTIAFGSIILYNNTTFNDRQEMFIVKYSSDGSVIWAKSAGGIANDIGSCIIADESGNLYVSGHQGNNPGTYILNPRSYIFKYDANGNVLWTKYVGGRSSQIGFGNNIALDVNNNIYITGYFDSPSLILGSTVLNNTNSDTVQTRSDIFIAKLNASATSITEGTNNPKINIFPNPTASQFHISNLEPGNWTITIYILDGQPVFKKELTESNATIDLSGKAKGTYVYRLLKDGEVFKSGKLVLE